MGQSQRRSARYGRKTTRKTPNGITRTKSKPRRDPKQGIIIRAVQEFEGLKFARKYPKNNNGSCWPTPSQRVVTRTEFAQHYSWEKTLGVGGQGRVDLYERLSGKGFIGNIPEQCFFAVKATAKWLKPQVDLVTHLQNAEPDVPIVKVLNWTIEPDAKNGTGYEYSVMEYCEGGDLAQLLHRTTKIWVPFPESFLWHVYLQLSKALAFLHDGMGRQNDSGTWTPIIHRDIKTQNVFLSYAGPERYPHVRIADFDLARFDDGGRHSDRVGSPMWTPPETWRDVRNPVATRAADIWAIGAIIQALATGIVPGNSQWRDEDWDQAKDKTIKRVVVPISDPKFGYSKRLQGFVELALAPEESDRPNASELYVKLRDFLSKNKLDQPDVRFLRKYFDNSPNTDWHGRFFTFNDDVAWDMSDSDVDEKLDYLLAGHGPLHTLEVFSCLP